MLKMNRKKVIIRKIHDSEDDYVQLSPGRRVSLIWELTAEVWSLKDKKSAKRRLQRHRTRFIKNKQSTGREKDRVDAKNLKKLNH